jgi:hypothetical protein
MKEYKNFEEVKYQILLYTGFLQPEKVTNLNTKVNKINTK